MYKEMSLMSDYFDSRGLQEEDLIRIVPSYGKKRKIKIKRKVIDFYSTDLEYKHSSLAGSVLLPSQKNESFHIQIKQEEVRGRNNTPKKRYFIIVLKGCPIKLNGNYIFSAYLERKDIVEIGFNQLHFESSDIELTSDERKHKILTQNHLTRSSLSILIEGETGTGKTSLAREIHQQSLREGKFVHLNVSSFSKNLLESELFGHIKGSFTGALNDKVGAIREAHKGTLFLDEIDSLPMDIQTKLLLFLDDNKVRPVGSSLEHQVDLRIIFSSGQKLQNLLKQSKMRKDFYFRLSSGELIQLRPLRETPVEIRKFCLELETKRSIQFSPELIEFYETLPWPGNYRQLKGHLERKYIHSKSSYLRFDHLDEELLSQDASLFLVEDEEQLSLKEIKIKYAKQVYFKNQNNYKISAEKLGISVRSLRNMIGYEPIK